eukprot:COSAG05_NODE_1967_length_3771_cov_3.260076_1_plen_352_part_00
MRPHLSLLRASNRPTWSFWTCQRASTFTSSSVITKVQGGDQANILRLLLESYGYKVWYDNGVPATDRTLPGMMKGVTESLCLLIFLSGRRETDAVHDPHGEYEGPFTRWFCHEEMSMAWKQELNFVGVLETEERFCKPDFALEKKRAKTGNSGGAVHANAARNVRLLDQLCFIPFRRQAHEVPAMIEEITRQAKLGAAVEMCEAKTHEELWRLDYCMLEHYRAADAREPSLALRFYSAAPEEGEPEDPEPTSEPEPEPEPELSTLLRPVVSAEQIATLQARVEAMHAAQLLTEEELFALEDICVDYIALGLVTSNMVEENAVASNLVQLVRVSEGVAADSSFARQARRKFV